MIAVRTNASADRGIGHLARSNTLAIALGKHYGYDVVFFVDEQSAWIEQYLSPFECRFLYRKNERYGSELSDSSRFLALIKGRNIEAVIVDDYRFSHTWERNVKTHGQPVIVLDDRNSKRHHCSLLIDAKWTGDSTAERYKDKVSKGCVKLLGPHYALLEDAYSKESKDSKNGINIIVNFGGGGDMAVMTKIVESLLDYAPDDADFFVRPVVGVFSRNQGSILSLAKREPQVIPIVHAKSIHECLSTTTLYVGAAGTTMYEVMSMSIPAITFSMSKNQENKISDLEDFGHYFHLDYLEEESFGRLSKLAWLMVSQLDRLHDLYDRPKKIKIDGLGAQRCATAIAALIREEIIGSEAIVPTPEAQTFDSTYGIEMVDDKHVNRYLAARNLSANHQNMPIKNDINRLDHYLWWLTTERISYELKRDGLPLLYFWHHLKEINQENVLIGGWFVCSESCTVMDTIYTLNWQIEMTDSIFPDCSWLAAIKKTNKFVQLLNKRFQFKLIDPSCKMYNVAQKAFPEALPNDFLYFWRPAVGLREKSS